MKTTHLSALCLVVAAFSSMTAACTADADGSAASEDGLTMGVPEGEPIAPPFFETVSPGSFALSRNLANPDLGQKTTLDLTSAGGNTGTATLRTTFFGAPVAEGEPIVAGVPGLPPPPPDSTRAYKVSAVRTACGKIYEGRAAGGNTVKIFDYRDLGPSCPAMIASEAFVEETVGGVKSTWYGKPSGGEVFPADATKLVARNAGGGFTAPPAPGSECAIGAADFQLTIATRKLVWEVCEFSSYEKPLTKARGERTLTPAELASVVAAAKGVKISTQQICGADKPYMTLTVSTPASQVEYKDDFYSCAGSGPFVSNIDSVFSAFRAVLAASHS